MYTPPTPITNHQALPDEVPLVAGFHDDRNRLSYQYPRLAACDGVNTPVTRFFQIEGSVETTLSCDYREITKFMQDISTQNAFIRSDFSSAKLEKKGRKITSQDPYDIKQTMGVLIGNLIETQRHIGGKIAVREYIPHEIEIRFFIREGSVVYHEEVHEDISIPSEQITTIAEEFDTLSWAVDFIYHSESGEWVCIEMGLNGLYYSEESRKWIAISEHPDPSMSPEEHTNKMPNPDRFSYLK